MTSIAPGCYMLSVKFFYQPMYLKNNVYGLLVCLMVINATFNNISVISWLSVLLMEEIGGPGKNH
jgi:ABC-type lipoprotein release transport system permease subunit